MSFSDFTFFDLFMFHGRKDGIQIFGNKTVIFEERQRKEYKNNAKLYYDSYSLATVIHE